MPSPNKGCVWFGFVENVLLNGKGCGGNFSLSSAADSRPVSQVRPLSERLQTTLPWLWEPSWPSIYLMEQHVVTAKPMDLLFAVMVRVCTPPSNLYI